MEYRLLTISKRGFFTKYYDIMEDDKLLYTAESKWWFKGFNVFAPLGNKVMDVYKPFSFMHSKFNISVGDQEIASVRRKIKFFNSEIEIFTQEHDYRVVGNIWDTDFTIERDDFEIAKISRKTFRSKNKYGIACQENADIKLIIGISLVIELIIRIKRASRS